MTNTLLLDFAIRRAMLTKRGLARSLTISETAFYQKLNGTTEFKASEIAALAEIMRLSEKERDEIFFAKNVIKNQLPINA